jgi:conjugal transfer/entry exclusion protein
MTVEQIQKQIEESRTWLDRQNEESTYKRDLQKRIELLNWVLENMKNPDIQICSLIESKMNEVIDRVNKMDSAIKADPLHSELRILDYILYQVCSNEMKKV